MLETPKSAKTPSTARIPNSCGTSAILENGACTSFTFAPKILSRSRANSSACTSRSRLINRPEVSFSAIASECPPAPSVATMYVPSGLMRSHSSTSSNSTGVCGAANLANLNSQVFERLVVFVCIRLVLQLVQNSCVVHDFQIVQVPKDVHVSLGLRRFP